MTFRRLRVCKGIYGRPAVTVLVCLLLFSITSPAFADRNACVYIESKHVLKATANDLSSAASSQATSQTSSTGPLLPWPCDALLAHCLETDPGSRELLRQIRECWGPDYANWSPSVECMTECLGEKCGSYTPLPGGPNQPWIKPGRITLCYKGCEEDLYNCSTVRHELQHMLDYCRGPGLGSCNYTDPNTWLECLEQDYYTSQGCYQREQRAYCVGDYPGSTACCPSDYNGTPPPGDGRPRNPGACCKSVCRSCAEGDSQAASDKCYRGCYNFFRDSLPLPEGHTPPAGGCVGECVWTGPGGGEQRIILDLPDQNACGQFCQLCHSQHGDAAECYLWGDDGNEIRSSSSSGSSSSGGGL